MSHSSSNIHSSTNSLIYVKTSSEICSDDSLNSCSLNELNFDSPLPGEQILEFEPRAPSVEIPCLESSMRLYSIEEKRSSEFDGSVTSTTFSFFFDSEISENIEKNQVEQYFSSYFEDKEAKNKNQNLTKNRQRFFSFQENFKKEEKELNNNVLKERAFSEPILPCGFCSSVNSSLLNWHSKKNCPLILQMNPCKICGAFGSENHTETYCPAKNPVNLKIDQKFENERKRRAIERATNFKQKYSPILEKLNQEEKSFFLHEK